MKTKTTTITVSPISPVSPVLTDTDLGQQLTAQYHRAVSGMREVLLFGAMLMQVEAIVSNVDTTLPTRGPTAKGTGLKGWLEQNAPEIRRPTAYRFLGITKAVAAEYDQIVGTRIAKKYDLPTLALADPATLDEPAAAKQLELFDYVSGTSQRSWLDQIRAPQPIELGGDTRQIDPATGERINHAPRRTDAEIAREIFETKATIQCSYAQRSMESLLTITGPDKEPAWCLLDDTALDTLKATAHDLYQGCLSYQNHRTALRRNHK